MNKNRLLKLLRELHQRFFVMADMEKMLSRLLVRFSADKDRKKEIVPVMDRQCRVRQPTCLSPAREKIIEFVRF